MTWNFGMQAIDHIINSAAKTLYMSGGQMRCPIVFRGPNGAASRVGAQHSHDYASWYANVPGLKVVAPYDAADAKGLLKAAIGKAKVRREGTDVTIVSHSRMVGRCLEAADILAEAGISAVINSVKKTNRLVCAEEGWGQSGIGSEVATRVVFAAFDYLDAPPERVFQADVPLPYAANLEALSLPGTVDVVEAAKRACYV